MGFNSFRQVAKLVFFLLLIFSLFYLVLGSYFIFCSFLPFFYYFIRFFTFSFIIANYLGYLNTFLPRITGDGVLIPDFDKLLEAYCLMRILSEEFGVRGNDGSLFIASFKG